MLPRNDWPLNVRALLILETWSNHELGCLLDDSSANTHANAGPCRVIGCRHSSERAVIALLVHQRARVPNSSTGWPGPGPGTGPVLALPARGRVAWGSKAGAGFLLS